MSSKAERVFYIGLESSPGTAVTVDTALRVKDDSSLKPKVDKIKVDEDIGSFAPARHFIGSEMSEGEINMTGYYDQLPYPLSMALGDGNPSFNDPDTDWNFPWPDGTLETFATYTAEYGDGADHIIKTDDLFATALEISGEAGQAWEIKATVEGAEVSKPAAHGATPSPTASPRTIKMADTTLHIDDTYAGLGTTEAAVLISFTWKIEKLQHHKLFAGALYPTGRGNDRWDVTLEVIVEVENSVVESEMDKQFTEDLSFVQILADDSTAASTYEANISGSYFLQSIETLDDRDGNNTMKLTYKGQKDTSDNTGFISCNSVLAAL